MSVTVSIPEVQVVYDYDGYFENLVRSWIGEKALAGGTFAHQVVSVEAGPWRPYAVRIVKDDSVTIGLDFYAALRVGFGALSDTDVAAIKDRL